MSYSSVKIKSSDVTVISRNSVDHQILQGIDLDIYEKQVTALIGPSGAGKSTYLRCLNRMTDTNVNFHVDGLIVLDQTDIKKLDLVQLRARVGMVFQKPNPFPRSIYNNVAYGPKIHGLYKNKQERHEIVQTSLEQAGLWNEVKDDLRKSGFNLSVGQQQRLCIARALAVKPEVLLMDEPCSALDPRATEHIEELIQELSKSLTIVIVTHQMKQAKTISHRTAFLHSGKIEECRETKELFTSPQSPLTQEYLLHDRGIH